MKMSIAQKFEEFTNNLKIPQDKVETIRNRYEAITKRLNTDFWNSSSETEHSLYVGSYGRDTDIKTSDIDVLFWLPLDKKEQYENYQSNGQSALLQEIKKSIKGTYPKTKIKADGQVVVVDFSDGICFELLPCFKDEEDNDTFWYVDTHNGGKWRKTKPRLERDEIREKNNEWKGNLKRLCRMARAWRDDAGVSMGGLLIDTFAYNFLKNWEYKDKSFAYYDWMIRDFFEFLSKQDDTQKYWLAVGSNQQVYNKGKFKRKAKIAHKLALEAIEYEEKQQEYSANEKWRDIFGKVFPKAIISTESLKEYSYENTEEFIEDKFSIDIKFDLKIDCEVSQKHSLMNNLLSVFLQKNIKLPKSRELKFYISEIDISEPYDIYWKVLNRGSEAKIRKMIRGQINKGNKTQQEHTDFMGNHYVECYIVKNNVVVARDRIDVPIE